MTDDSHVAVEWSGKKLLLRKDKLDEWYHLPTDEQRVDYINSHHEYRHTGDPINVYRISKTTTEKRNLQEPDDLVLVHWSGTKVLLLERSQLDDWYHSGYEDHCEFVKRHPESLLH